MTKRIGFASLCGFLFALTLWAGPAQAETLNSQTARATMVEKLTSAFGSEFTGATSSWVACPPEAILDYDGLIAYCMSEFGTGRTRRFVSATIEEDLVAEISVNRQWTRKWRRCGSGHLKHLRLDGVLWENDRRCSTDTLMASDLAGYARLGHLKRKRIVGWHGTNTAGFGRVVLYRCRIKRRGDLYRVRCQNLLGDAFKLRMRV